MNFYFKLLFLTSFLINIEAFAKQSAEYCYMVCEPQSNCTYYRSLSEAQSFDIAEAAKREPPVDHQCFTSDMCLFNGTSWNYVPGTQDPYGGYQLIYNYIKKYVDGTESKYQYQVSSIYEEPISACANVPPTQNTSLPGINISNGGLDLTSDSGNILTKNGSPLDTCSDSQEACGDPVNISTGLMWHRGDEFELRGKTAATKIRFFRTYVSQPALGGNALGKHWFHNYQSKIVPFYIDGLQNLIWIDENGGAYVFKNDGIKYVNPPGFFGGLKEYTDRYELIKPDQTKYIFTKVKNTAPVGSLINIIDPHGEKIILTYNSTGLLEAVEAGFAGKIIFSYNAKRLLTRVLRQRDNLSYNYSYDDSDNLISIIDFKGRKKNYSYLHSEINYLNGLMSYFIDELGRKNSFFYDNKGRVIKEVEKGNFERTFKYNVEADGLKSTSYREIDSSLTTFYFDSEYRLIKIIRPDSSINRISWNVKNLKETEVDAAGFEMVYKYDENSNLNFIHRPADTRSTQLVFDLDFNKPKLIITSSGSAINLELNPANGDYLKIVRDEASIQFEHDQFGNIVSTNNGLSTYSEPTDSNGLKTTHFDAHNPENLFYDIRGRIIKRQFQSGRIINYTYDDYDRVTLITDNYNPTVKYTYDIIGRLIQKDIFSATKKEITKYQWDERDRLVQVTDNIGRKTQYQYNAATSSSYVIDKPSAIIAPDGKTTVFKYDIMQRLIQKIDPDGSLTKYEYDLRGDLIKLTDAEGNYTTFGYDGNRRVIKRNAPTVLTDSKGVSRSAREIALYTYDDADHLLKEERSLDQINAKKTVTTYTYDNLDRLVSRNIQKIKTNGDVEDSKTSTFSYEPILDAELLKTADNEIAKISFEHETLPPYNLTRSISKAADSSNPLRLIESDMTMSYDISGELALLKSINGSTVLSAQHDPAGRLINIKTGEFLNPNGPVFESNIAYDDFGRKVSLTNSDGLKQTLAYDQLSRLNSLAWTKGNSIEVSQKLTYDLAGNIVSSKRENAETIYVYDKVNQLISAHSQNESRNFQYDKVGNRIKDSISGSATFVSNAIVSDRKAPHAYNIYAYDLDGLGNLATLVNEKEKAQKDFTYHLNGKLDTFQYSLGSNGDSILATYFYDALDRRVAKNIQIANGAPRKSFTQAFSYLGDEEKILLSKNGAGAFTLFVDGQRIDEHLGEVTSSTAKSYLTDHLGSVLNTDASAGIKMFGSFGDRLSEDQIQSAFGLNENSNPVSYGFAGREYDFESGFYYNRARFYDPSLGRFLTPDPIEFHGGNLNFYLYANNGPITFSDPEGLQSLLTDMNNNKTIFDPGPYPGEKIVIETRNKVDRRSLPGANDSFKTVDVNWDKKHNSPAYGPLGAYVKTGDPRGRDIHGGGSSLANPFADSQGWLPTMGCTRGQNADVKELGLEIDKFKKNFPNVKVPYYRVKIPWRM